MNMSYNSNPNIPKVRAQAVKMVRAGYSTREVARHFGYSQSATVKWCQKIHPEERQFMIIPTESSRPHSHPRQLDPAVVRRILELRAETRRGAEFSKWFTKKLAEQSTEHRYTRIRKPNDNAHIERFNRTIQEECISRLSHNLTHWQQAMPECLHYYNQERPHMGLNWLTPNEKLEQFFTCK